MILNIELKPVAGVAARVAALAGAPVAQVSPGKDSVLVAVVPVEADGVVAHLRNLVGTDRRLEHLQAAAGSSRSGLVGPAMALFPLVVAVGAGAGIAQVDEGVAALVAVLPEDFHGAAAALVDLDGGGLDWGQRYAHGD